jgi:hypothetical protein
LGVWHENIVDVGVCEIKNHEDVIHVPDVVGGLVLVWEGGQVCVVGRIRQLEPMRGRPMQGLLGYDIVVMGEVVFFWWWCTTTKAPAVSVDLFRCASVRWRGMSWCHQLGCWSIDWRCLGMPAYSVGAENSAVSIIGQADTDCTGIFF